MTISGHTITLNRGDGTTDTVTVPDNDTVYSHPTHPGDDFSVDSGALTGATVISDIDINLTTDTSGHVTDANGVVSTRNLTLSDLGYTGATNANNYSHPTGAGNKHVPTGGTAGQLLTNTASGTGTWQDAPVSLPSQTGHNGKYLTTDGSSSSWAEVPSAMDYTESATAPVSPNDGDMWLDTGDEILYQRQSTNWVQISDDGTAQGDGNLTTKGDLEVFGTTQERLPVGSNGQVLKADSSATHGVAWDSISVGSSEIADNAVTMAKIADADVVTLKSGRKNLIINGGMQVAQRGTSFTGMTTSGVYDLDRYSHSVATAGTWTMSQSSNAPSGFASSHRAEVTTAGLSTAGSYISLSYKVEAQDLQQLAYGSSEAKQATVSFWVRSSTVGNYSVWLYRYDGGRTISKTVTINTADTWERKSVLIDSDTTGAIANDNTAGILLRVYYAAGSDYTSGTQQTSWGVGGDPCDTNQVNLASTVGNYIEITGVQLELGDTATDFEHRSYGEELALCQRYYQIPLYRVPYREYVYNVHRHPQSFPVKMRTEPSLTGSHNYSGGSATGLELYQNGFDGSSYTLGISTTSIGATPGANQMVDLGEVTIIADAEL